MNSASPLFSRTSASLRRAAALLGDPRTGAEVVMFKLQESSACHCFHCWPQTWAAVNDSLAPQGPLEDEGDLLVTVDGGQLALECHEGGPEILVYVTAATAVIALTASLIDLVNTIIKARQEEIRPSHGQLRLTSRRVLKGLVEDETVVEIGLPISSDTEKLVATQVKKALRRHT
jgi:hypothetical protein